MFRLLYKNLDGYKNIFYLSIIFKIFEVICEVQIPFIIGKVVDAAVDGYSDAVRQDLLLILILSITAIVFSVISTINITKAIQGMVTNLRLELYEKIQSYTFYDLNAFSKGTLITRLTTNINSIANSGRYIVMSGVRLPIFLTLAVYKTLNVNVGLASYVIYGILVNIVVMSIVLKLAVPLTRRYTESIDELNEEVSEEIINIENSKLFVQENFIIERFKLMLTRLCAVFTKYTDLNLTVLPVCNLTIFLSISLVMWRGGLMVLNHQFSPGSLLTFSMYITSVFTGIMVSSILVFHITTTIPLLERIKQVLEHKIAFTDPVNPHSEPVDLNIEFKDVSFRYTEDSPEVLKDINLKIERGQHVAIIGATGSGKSSLVQLIPHLYEVSTGSVSIGGVNVREYTSATLNEQIAFVLQQNTLFSGDLRENLQLGAENANDEQLWQALEIAQAASFVREKDGLDTVVEAHGNNFSGGQRQRLCIARALVKDAPILILDDATSALDVATEKRLQESLGMAYPDLTTITIAQRITSVQTADLIVVMDLGRIYAIGKHDDLLKNCDIYQEIYQSQQKVAKV